MVVIAHAIARCASAVTLDFFSAMCKDTGGGTGKKRVTTVYISPVTMSNHFTKFSDATESIRIVPHLPLKERHAVIPFFLPFAEPALPTSAQPPQKKLTEPLTPTA